MSRIRRLRERAGGVWHLCESVDYSMGTTASAWRRHPQRHERIIKTENYDGDSCSDDFREEVEQDHARLGAFAAHLKAGLTADEAIAAFSFGVKDPHQELLNQWDEDFKMATGLDAIAEMEKRDDTV